MSILLSLSPFAVFFALMRLVSPIAGLIGALVVSVLLCARMLRRGESVKILEIGSVSPVRDAGRVYAPRRAALDRGDGPARGRWRASSPSSSSRSPSAGRSRSQYARERVPEPIWALPVFFTTNRFITIVWAGAFAVHVAADAAAEYVPGMPLWLDIVASIAAFIGAVWFTRWYPAAVQRRFAGAAAS